jgi:hypothetical protein
LALVGGPNGTVGLGVDGGADVAVGAGVAVAAGGSIGATAAVGADMSEAEGATVAVATALGVAEGAIVGVCVGGGGGVTAVPKVTARSGGCADSRLPRLIAVALLSVTARLTSPLPVTSEVTFTLTVAPAATGPEATDAVPIAGAFEALVFVSLQVVLETAWTEMPALLAELAYSLRTAWPTGAPAALRSKRR